MNMQSFYFRLSYILIALFFFACSNYEGFNSSEWEKKRDYLPIDDTEYPYAGIPRIVIETENFRQIRDRETEIPAKLQIWGEKAPESDVIDLTIRGRGNITWLYPKPSYAIKFNQKQAFLGMPKAKKWVMLANYRDRTLIRNALAFEIARQTSQKWVPQGKFADVFLNKRFIGNYYICEKIEAKQTRLNLSTNDFLLEFDTHFDSEYKFVSYYKKLPVNIKYPNSLTQESFSYIHAYIDSIECVLYKDCKNTDIRKFIDLQSLASYWIVQEVTQNLEITYPKSVYAYKDSILQFGPVWDFDWQTFTSKKKGLGAKDALWLKPLRENKNFRNIVRSEWDNCKKRLSNLIVFIDSLADYIKISNEQNTNRWRTSISDDLAGDEDLSTDSAIQLMKNVYLNRLNELDSLF